MTGETTKQYLTFDEIVQLTGLSESTLRRRVKDGSLPVIQPGGPGTKMIFSLQAFLQFVSPTSPTATEPPAKETEQSEKTAAIDEDQETIPGPPPKWRRFIQ